MQINTHKVEISTTKWEKTGICLHRKKPVGLTVKNCWIYRLFACVKQYLVTVFSYNGVAIWGAIV